MIYTVTFNPSLDYIVGLKNFEAGKVNRSNYEQILPGGKGINVSVVLKNLGYDSTALGFIAGFTGDEIERRVKDMGCNTRFIPLKEGFSRINVKVRAEEESEINGRGPNILKEDINMLFEMIDEIKSEDILILAGSIPDALPDSIYMDILERLKARGNKTVVDATGKLLVNVLKYHPFLIKPNNHEMEEIFGTVIKTEEELISYGRKLIDMGACNVLISRAGDGAILITGEGKVIVRPAVKGEVVNSVGAGDSMVAGFIAGYLEKGDFEYALKIGLAAGSASAFSENLATKEEVQKYMW